MKKIIAGTIIILIGSAVWATDVSTTLISSGSNTQLKTELANSLGLGFYKSGTAEASVLTWNPDLRLSSLGVGLDLNVSVGENKPADLESLVVRFVELDSGNWGLRYGVLQNITLGYGLLMTNYSTSTKGGSILNNNQTGLKGYVKTDQYGIEALGTRSQVSGARVTENIFPNLILGQTYVADQNVSGYSLDAGIPLTDWSGFYAEYARLNNHGSGAITGFGAGQDFTILAWNFKAERRLLERNFVPGYFNDQHDINPINLAAVEATGSRKDGWLASLGAKALDLAAFNWIWEYYDGSNPALEAEVSAKFYENYFISAKFSQPNFQDFRSIEFANGAILTGRAGYKINPFTNLILNYKKAYDPVLVKVIESYRYELKINF